MRNYSVIIALLLSSAAVGQSYELEVTRVNDSHNRGLWVESNTSVWLSGSEGVVTHLSGPKLDSIRMDSIDDNKSDLRDIEMVNGSLIVTNTASPGRVYRGLETFTTVFEDTAKTAFLDGISFWNSNDGAVFGDPVNGRFQILITADGGATWSQIPDSILPDMEGEAGFAASGTSIQCVGESTLIIGTGGTKSRLLRSDDKGKSWELLDAPMATGEGKGIFSLYFWNEAQGVVVGGSYIDSTKTKGNYAFTIDGGKSWSTVNDYYPPEGYKSCVCGNDDGTLLFATGRTGVDYSTDKGRSWKNLSKVGFYSCAFGDDKVFLSGKRGKFGVINLSDQ